MRITNKTLTNTFLRNLSRNLEQMQKYQDQLSSGKEVSRPSDNPMLVSKIMFLKNNILQNKQYNSNINDTIGWVETQDTALNDMTATLNRIRDLIIYGANGSLSDTDRAAIKDEVDMQIDQLADILNTNFDGRYIFAGQETLTRPFEKGENGLEYLGDDSNIFREISHGVEIGLITSGSSLTYTEDANTEDLGELLGKIVEALDTGDMESLAGELLSDIDKHIDTVIRVRSSIGAIHNRLEAAKDRNESENMNLTKLLSDREDIDVAEKYMEYSVMAVVYQASLSVGTKILQPSLLDYLN
ncbi:MAG TPA: flagellar hook-associated protein FlgL [Tissierellaceae bacterium]|nr:flagellar hook-associated protein FlgL [Tissierellaceae bacterium]